MSGAGIFWLASYPKSGNTWTRALIASLIEGGARPVLAELVHKAPIPTARAWIDDETGIETSELMEREFVELRRITYLHVARRAKAPLFYKVHDAFDPRLFPSEITRGVVHIVRDPRDVAPSFAHHMNYGLDRSIARMNKPNFSLGSLRRFNLQAPQFLGSWSSHVSSWLGWREAPQLLLRYEDMIADPACEARRLAEFLRIPASAEIIARAAAACGFDNLRAAEQRDGFAERSPGNDQFFRRGIAGGWRDTLTPDQAARIVADHGQTMRRLGYDTGDAP